MSLVHRFQGLFAWFTPARIRWVLVGVWVGWQVPFALTQGVFASVDTQRYDRIAEGLLMGQFPAGPDVLYVTYASLLAVCHGLGVGHVGMIALQVLASGLAALALYRIAMDWLGSMRKAYLVVAFFVAWPKFAQWNFIVYTDALFAYGSIFLLWGLTRPRTGRLVVLWVVGAGLVTLLRPMGMAIWVGLWAMGFVVLLTRWVQRTPWAWVQALGYLGFSLFLGLWVVDRYVAPSEYLYSELSHSYQTAEVIYPNIPYGVEESSGFHVPSMGPPKGWGRLFAANADHIAKLAVIKLGLLFGHIKPYYTLPHNLFIGLYLYPIYLLALRGLGRRWRDPLCAYMLAFVAAQAFVVSLTTENWDGRFLLPLLPVVFLWAGAGVYRKRLVILG